MGLDEPRTGLPVPTTGRAPREPEPAPHLAGPYYRYNAAERQVYLSPFHLRPDRAADYVRALRRHRVEWLTGYAVSWFLLAQLVLGYLRAIVSRPVALLAPGIESRHRAGIGAHREFKRGDGDGMMAGKVRAGAEAGSVQGGSRQRSAASAERPSRP